MPKYLELQQLKVWFYYSIFEGINVVSCGVISCWGLDDLCVVDGLVCEDESVTSIINT